MKHNLLTAANGLQTPIERSQRKSTTSSIHSTLFTSLLALFLLMVGNSALWADCTFTANSTLYFDLRTAAWYTANANLYAEFFTDDTSRGETQMSETGTSHVYSVSLPNRNDVNKIVINRYSPDGGGHQWKWGYTIDMEASNAGSNDCIYMPTWTGDPVSCNWATFGSGSITTGCGPAALNCRLMGDFWLKADHGWLGTDKGPQFIDNGDGTATISYLVNTQAPRFTFVKDGIETSENKWDDTHSTQVGWCVWCLRCRLYRLETLCGRWVCFRHGQ